VASAEVVDVLLDLRLILLDSDSIPDEALNELLEEPTPSTAG
jgi:hypothetical protein